MLLIPVSLDNFHRIVSSSILIIFVWKGLVINPTILWIFCSQRLVLLTTPSTELPKTKQEQEKLLAIFAADGNSLRQKSPPTKDGYFPVDKKESHC